jgi:hypothetical protein
MARTERLSQRLRQEAIVLAIVAMPALVVSLGSHLLLITGCKLLWHSSCASHLAGIRHIDEPIQIARTHVPPELITPVVLGTYRGP